MLCVATAVCLVLLSVLSFTSARCVRMESVRVWRYFIAVPCVVTLIVLSRHCPAMACIAFSADVWFSMQSTMRDARVVTVSWSCSIIRSISAIFSAAVCKGFRTVGSSPPP